MVRVYIQTFFQVAFIFFYIYFFQVAFRSSSLNYKPHNAHKRTIKFPCMKSSWLGGGRRAKKFFFSGFSLVKTPFPYILAKEIRLLFLLCDTPWKADFTGFNVSLQFQSKKGIAIRKRWRPQNLLYRTLRAVRDRDTVEIILPCCRFNKEKNDN